MVRVQETSRSVEKDQALFRTSDASKPSHLLAFEKGSESLGQLPLGRAES